MTSLDVLAGKAQGGTLYGIGVGPGDVRYLTLRAAGLVGSVDVVAFFAKKGQKGNARRIVVRLCVHPQAHPMRHHRGGGPGLQQRACAVRRG